MGACRRSTRWCLLLLAAIFNFGLDKTAEALTCSGSGRSSLRLAGGKCDCEDFGRHSRQKGQSLRALVLDRRGESVLVHRLRGGHRMRWDLFKHLLSRYDTDKDSFLSRDEVDQQNNLPNPANRLLDMRAMESRADTRCPPPF
jgi:hypothetical protein